MNQKLLIFSGALILLQGCKYKNPLVIESQKSIKESFTSRKKGLGVVAPAEVRKNIKHMTFEEAQRAKEYYEQIGDLYLAHKALKHMRDTAKDLEKVADLLFELANLEMALGDYEKAQLHYKEFKILYPGDPRIRQVLYYEMLAHLSDQGESSKDQTKTYEILGLAERFLQEPGNIDEGYTQKVLTIIERCYALLIEHEIVAIRFYLHKFSYTHQAHLLLSVTRRIMYIQKELLPHLIPFNNNLLKLDAYLTDLSERLQEWEPLWERKESDKHQKFVNAQEAVEYVKAVKEGEQRISHAAHAQQASEATPAEIQEHARVLEKAVTHIEHTLFGTPAEKLARDRF